MEINTPNSVSKRLITPGTSVRHVRDHPREGLERGPHVPGSKGGILDQEDEL